MNVTEWLALPVEQLAADAGAGAQGPAAPQGFVAGSAAALSRALADALALDITVPGSGAGTYVAACLGVKPTGGYSVAIGSARRRADQIVVRLALTEPGNDVFAFQAITSPFAVALVRDLDPGGKTFSFEAELSWQVLHVPG